ncbi:hypothetical protein B0H14DRAFT_3884503 [Mycena olivaceomarginata]|nr:hypothetical protein B0H14DRAFT_3884503 [Mycena olivaceomarginata]
MSNPSHQTPSTPSIFDNDEQDDRQSLSSADVSAAGALEDATREKTPPPRARAAIQLYATPQARSVTSSIAAPAKAKLEKVSPGGRSCIVTNEEFPYAAIDAAHLLPRATKADLLAKLEFSFNLKYKQLHIDTTRNLAYLRADQHWSFDHKGFILLPTNADLMLVHAFTFTMDTAHIKTYKEVFAERKTFEYRIVPLQLSRDGNAVFCRQDPEYKKIFPLANPTTLPTVQSHVNPFFVIANAGPKLGPGMDLVPDDIKRTSALYVDLSLLDSLWATWSSRTPPQMWREAKYMRRGGDGNGGGGAGNNGRVKDPMARVARSRVWKLAFQA